MNMRLSFCLKQIAFCPVAGYHYNQCNLNSYTFVRSEQSQRNILEVVRLVSLVVEKWQIFMFPLSCFRLNALYSISSHSSIEDLKKMNWPYSVEDNRCIWKHPIMSVDNKLFLTLLSFRLYKTAYIYMRIKRKIKNIIFICFLSKRRTMSIHSFFARHCYLLRSRRNYLNHIVSNYPTNDIINGFFVFFCIIHLLYDGHS